MTMNNNAPEKKQVTVAKRRRRRSSGVPVALVAALLAIVFFLGGLMGFAICNKTNTYRRQLDEAKAQIAQLENTLTMMGFSSEESSLDEWVFDDTGSMDEFGDLGGSLTTDAAGALWNDSSLIDGMLQATGDPVVVAEFDGGVLMSDEVIEPYNDRLTTQVFGFYDAAEVSGDTLSYVLQELVTEKICEIKAQELGLMELTDADVAQITADAESDFADQKRFYAAYVSTDGMTAEEADAAVADYLAREAGVTLEGLIAQRKENYWQEKLFDEVVKDVTVSDEDVQAEYDALLAEQTELFALYPEEYEFAAMSGQTIAYNPDGYRRVKHILLAFEDPADVELAASLTDQIAALNPETDMEQISTLQTELDALYADLEAQASSIIDEITAGASFDALIEAYGMDEGMDYEPTKSEGYAVSAASTARFSPDFVEGALMLENPGDVSVPVRSVSGVHIIKYVSDVVPGPVPMSTLTPALTSSLLAEAQEAHYIDTVAQWLQSANAKYYPERLQ